MSTVHSYPSIYTIGHSALAGLFDGDVIIEEKLDGSQISFGLHHETGELKMRSKSVPIVVEAPPQLFEKAVATARELAPLLKKGWTYRGEYLAKPKHNTLCYDRIPAKHIIIFDIETGPASYLDPGAKAAEAERLGLECVPCFYQGPIGSAAELRKFLGRSSVLGKASIEGIVVKPAKYDLFGRDKKVLLAKFVSEDFKEMHGRTWEAEHRETGPVGIINQLAASITTTARWHKAVQHLRDAGTLAGEPADIGKLVKEVPADIKKEAESEIKQRLWDWAWPQLLRMCIRGLPEWYKEQLLKTAFTDGSLPREAEITDPTEAEKSALTELVRLTEEYGGYDLPKDAV